MTELEGAVLLAQVRRLDRIREHLRANRAIVEEIIGEVPGIRFRELPGPGRRPGHPPGRDLPRREHRRRGDRRSSARSPWPPAAGMSTPTWSTSWRAGRSPVAAVRSIARAPTGARPTTGAGMLPATDRLLERSMSFAIGVLDPNLAPFGIADARRPRRRGGQGRAVPRRRPPAPDLAARQAMASESDPVRRRITLDDVAVAAGVSRATASRALGDNPRISARTRTSVRAWAERLHYVPNAAARSLRVRRTRTLGLLLADLMRPGPRPGGGRVRARGRRGRLHRHRRGRAERAEPRASGAQGLRRARD